MARVNRSIPSQRLFGAIGARLPPLPPSSPLVSYLSHPLSRIKTPPPTHRRVPLTHAPDHTYRRQGTSHHMHRRGQEGQIGKENRRRVIVLSTERAAEGDPMKRKPLRASAAGEGLGRLCVWRNNAFCPGSCWGETLSIEIQSGPPAIYQIIFCSESSIGKQHHHHVLPATLINPSCRPDQMHHASRSGSPVMLSTRLPPPAFNI